jgi:hypothetical protein
METHTVSQPDAQHIMSLRGRTEIQNIETLAKAASPPLHARQSRHIITFATSKGIIFTQGERKTSKNYIEFFVQNSPIPAKSFLLSAA